MLSNPPPSGLHARQQQQRQQQRQHRRQNSTPTAFETMKINTNLPSSHQQHPQRHQHIRPRMSHRRGMSLDTRQQLAPSPTTNLRQEFPMVSNSTNNAGLTITPQHVLRETQQQRIAGPGPQQAYTNLASDENYLLSPHGTPQTQTFEGHCFNDLSDQQTNIQQFNFDLYTGPMNVAVKKNQESYSNNGSINMSQDFDLFPPSTLSTPTFLNFQDSPTGNPGWISEGDASDTRRSSRRISNGIMDRVSKFENLGIDAPSRPLTPPHQNVTGYFPLTPMETPQDRTIKHPQRPQRFSDDYDESMEETVKPTRSNTRPKTTFDEMRRAAEAQDMMPTPQRANTMPLPGAYDPASASGQGYMELGNGNGLTIDTRFDGTPGPSNPLSANAFSQKTSPITPHLGEFSGAFDNEAEPFPQSAGLEPPSTGGSPAATTTKMPSRRGSPHHHHRRNESVASIASAASIASLDIEKTKTTTGITSDDIQQYIQGPDPRDNKWVCTFEACGKKFGRKENIKSHVQTHLNDRQYQCPGCDKRFVRQHDLKRHAKIHTGIKPYPCECGNTFARHDALTRHKQRGMCIGAFDGIVRKVVKRGRPRKHRPDLDERQGKAARTRKKNQSVSSSVSSSSVSSQFSDSSAVNSPDAAGAGAAGAPDFDLLDDIMDVSMGGTTMNPSGLQNLTSSAPMPSLAAAASAAHSPSANSVHSYVSQLSHMSLHHQHQQCSNSSPMASSTVGADIDNLPSHPASPTKSVASQYNDPPELSLSSSPPPSRFLKVVEPNSSGATTLGDTLISSSSSAAAAGEELPGLTTTDDDDDDILLQFTNGNHHHHHHQGMLMLGADAKFDEVFDGVDMFSSSTDDLFFGS
ncbi:hypothetical protein F4778DRAFT_677640 [Xylariomycetidae sp. FL2044]|nr:hypothetical protein F4778DRAFT_677640 [Xylariomycetidae sp. FL2044]